MKTKPYMEIFLSRKQKLKQKLLMKGHLYNDKIIKKYIFNTNLRFNRNFYSFNCLFLVVWILFGCSDGKTNNLFIPSKVLEKSIDMKFSKEGQYRLIKMEGFKSKPYLDRGGNLTIGYGHKIKPREKFDIISPEEAKKIMLQDVLPLELFLNKHIGKLPQNKFDALILFIYNIGDIAFLNSSVFSDIKEKKFQEAMISWQKWSHITVYEKNKEGEIIKKLIPSQDLIKRRAQEILLFGT